jgi:hypothetical protein
MEEESRTRVICGRGGCAAAAARTAVGTAGAGRGFAGGARDGQNQTTMDVYTKDIRSSIDYDINKYFTNSK